MRDKFYGRLADVVVRRTGTVLVLCAAFTGAMVAASANISLKTRIADMMPKDIPIIDEFMEIIEDYSSESTVMITIEDPDKDLEKMRRCADDLAMRLGRIKRIRPDPSARLSMAQRIAALRGQHPIPGIPYDTLDLVRRIDYKVDQEFIEHHGMMIQETQDLENMVGMFGALGLPSLIRNINDNFEQEYIDDSQNMTTLDGEEQAVQGLEGIRKFLSSIGQWIDAPDSAAAARAVRQFVSGRQYMISPDNTMLLLMLQPAISFNEFEDLMYLGYRIDDTLSLVRRRYDDLHVSRTGAMMLQIDENNAMAKDFGRPSVFALLLILTLLIGSFRTWKNPFHSVVTLVVGIIWTAGILAITVRYLTMMSAGFGVVLIGLGIDFGIHFISGFKDGREQGRDPAGSIRYMFSRTARGVVTGALTTAIVFFTLPLTGFKAYAQMGIAMGTGIVSVLVAMMVLLPALIMWDHKGYSAAGSLLRRLGLGFCIAAWTAAGKIIVRTVAIPPVRWTSSALQFGFLETSGRILRKPAVAAVILVAAGVSVWLSLRGGMNMEFEYDMMKLQPQNTPGQTAQNRIIDKFEISPDFSMVKADDLEECRELVAAFKKVGNRTGLIGRVDAITEFLPPARVQERNREIILGFRARLEAAPLPGPMTGRDTAALHAELVRLHKNIVEIGELSIMSLGEKNKIIRKCDQIVGKRDEESEILALAGAVRDRSSPAGLGGFEQIMARVLRKRLLTMASTGPVTLESLPRTIAERYVNDRNDDLLISVYPRGYIWDQKQLARFNGQTRAVSPRITGMPAIMELMIDMMVEKGRLAVIIGAVAIFVFLLLDFRSISITMLAAVPLGIGFVWMVGLMAATGMKFSMMNFMALPIILGIGIDDGVHILHRYRIEGPASVPLVLKYTGRAILLTSLTTMIGFGSMGVASHQGLAALGRSLFLGVGSCFISSAFVLPALLTLLEKAGFNRKGKRVSH